MKIEIMIACSCGNTTKITLSADKNNEINIVDRIDNNDFEGIRGYDIDKLKCLKCEEEIIIR